MNVRVYVCVFGGENRDTDIEEGGERKRSDYKVHRAFVHLTPWATRCLEMLGLEAPSLTSINLNYTCIRVVRRHNESMCLTVYFICISDKQPLSICAWVGMATVLDYERVIYHGIY